MTTITSATLDQLLKRVYSSEQIEDLMNLTYPVLAECAGKGSAMLGGAGFYFGVRLESAEGHAFITETQTLPSGRQTLVKQALVEPVIQAGVVELSGLSRAVSSGNAMAFARGFDENVQSTMEAMSAYREGALFRDGSGVLATVVSGAGTANVTVSDASAFREGMYLSVFDKSTEGATDEWIHGSGAGATAAVLKVTGVDWVNDQIELDAVLNAAAAAGDEIYIAGSQAEADGTGPTDLEPIGFEGSLLDSGTYLGISRTTYANWRANVQAESGYLDESILLKARTRITQESGKPFTGMAKSFKLLVHPMQIDTLFKLAIPRIRYTGGDNVDLGNGTSVSFGGIPSIASYLCPTTKAYLGDFSKSQTLYAPGGELHIDTEYNGASLKWVATKDVGLVFMKSYFAYAVKNPVTFCRITGLTPSAK